MKNTIVTKNRVAKSLGMQLKDLNPIKIKLDGCKYGKTWRGEKHNHNKPVWYERRTDDAGSYYLLYTINSYYYREKGDRNGKRV